MSTASASSGNTPWAFRLAVYSWVLNTLLILSLANPVATSISLLVILVLGTLFTVLALAHQEPKNRGLILAMVTFALNLAIVSLQLLSGLFAYYSLAD